MEILQFIFQSFWHWLGTVILIGAIGIIVPSFHFGTKNITYYKKDENKDSE
jgi:hypothetical protein